MACTVQKAGDRKKFPGGPFPFGRGSRGRLVFHVCPLPSRASPLSPGFFGGFFLGSPGGFFRCPALFYVSPAEKTPHSNVSTFHIKLPAGDQPT